MQCENTTQVAFAPYCPLKFRRHYIYQLSVDIELLLSNHIGGFFDRHYQGANGELETHNSQNS